MYTKSAAFYDAIYAWKDYEAEADKLRGFIGQHLDGDDLTLLDVACGTGAHHPHLKAHYDITGIDLDKGMLKVAREREPDIAYYEGNMLDFDLGKQFDMVTCLFSSIAYLKTVENLNLTLQTFAKHTRPGGLVIVEPWLSPDAITEDYERVSVMTAEGDDFKVTRMTGIRLEGNISIIEFHYMLGVIGEGVQYFSEDHETALFYPQEYLNAFEDAGLKVTHDPVGLMDRGLYIGVKRG